MTDHIINRVQQQLPNIPLTVVSQGAEAVVFITNTHPYIKDPYLNNKGSYIIKYRPSKPYRHPKIDASITKNRTVGEVKFMSKLAKLGVSAPSVIAADFAHGIIWMEFLGSQLSNGEVSSFKNWLWWLERERSAEECVSATVEAACRNVGGIIAKLHLNDMIHGDLTSSNILLQDETPVLIDFGLSSYSGLAEDKAVDLYVLERAIVSTHSVHSEKYNEWLLAGYEHAHKGKSDAKKYAETYRKLADVRLRGRKRSMLG